MTGPDQPDDRPDDRPDPAQQARVRALLADLGSAGSHPPGPVPDDVAARLHAALAGLATPSTVDEPTAASGRARRRRRDVLVAAAVVVVVSAGGVTAAALVRDQHRSSSSAGSSADAGGTSREQAAAVPGLTRAGFATEAAEALTAPVAGRATDSFARSPLVAGCTPPPGRGTLRSVTFEGAPAVLVGRPARDGRRVVEAWTCDGARVLARTRVAVPPS